MRKSIAVLGMLMLTVVFMSYAQVKVDVNLNIKHSVDGVSDFGRDRHITVHSSATERDWDGQEDKLDYFVNDLDVYFGRDNGSGGWKNQNVTEDPEKPHWPDASSIEQIGQGLKEWYETDKFKSRHQYEDRMNMIMGITHDPIYPTLNWGNNGNAAGCKTYDVDAAAFWIGEYLDHHYAKDENDIGEPLPKYWECINEPDMDMMGWNTMFLSSPEKLWEFHNLCAKEIRARLGDKAPKIGGMTWGLHDFYSPDGVARMDAQYYYDNSDPAMYPIYDNMLESNVWQDKGDNWFQWDVEYQGFIDSCGANMDFYSMHLYDWPSANNTGRVRCGGLVEASLDLMEWYDYFKFGERKDIIISEYGSVSPYAHNLPYKRRDWEHLRPFNQMMMQFLERPSHVVLTMPFAPAKAQWGDFFEANGTLMERYIVTLMDPVGSYTETADKSRYDHEEWEWSGIIKWYELWKDVKGTRVDTKADDRDIQVDAYVDGNHMYLILNNLEITEQDIELNLFDDYSNPVKSVKITHQYLNENLGTQGEPVNDELIVATAPGEVTLNASATMILDYEFENTVIIDQESKELKYMCEPLTSQKTKFGGQMCHVNGGTGKQTANVNGVVVPAIGEATLRIGLQSYSADALNISINGHEIASGSSDWRGRKGVDGIGGWFGVAEIDVPIEYLKANNVIECTSWVQSATYTTFQIQTWDFTKAPKRSSNGDKVAISNLSLESSASIMQGKSKALTLTFTPENTTDKTVTWSSDNESVATVDEFGVVTVISSSGTADITATSSVNGSISSVSTITAIPYKPTPVSDITIDNGDKIDVEQYVTTPLSITVYPSDATVTKVEWSSSDPTLVYVDKNTGKVTGVEVNKSATVTAKLIDTESGDIVFEKSIEVFVTIVGDETAYSTELPEQVRVVTDHVFTVPVKTMGAREVIVELVKGDTKYGSGSKEFEIYGEDEVSVDFTLTQMPPLGTGCYLVVKLLKDGQVISNKTKEIEVIDMIRVQSVSIDDGVSVVQIDGTISMEASIEPSDAFNKNVDWSSGDPSIATIDESTGLLTAVSAGDVTITATSEDGSFTDTKTIKVQSGEVFIPLTGLTLPAKVQIFPESEYNMIVGYTPEWTTQKEIVWTSSKPEIASVDSDGKITTSETEGSAIITATSSVDSEIFATCTVFVSLTMVIEAEDFTATGGDYSGFEIYTTDDGIKGTNWNQLGDWAEYDITFDASGKYSVSYFLGTPNTGAGVSIYVDDVLVSSTDIPVGTSYDVFVMVEDKGTLNIPEAGTYKIRIESSGTSEWQWNCDRFELTRTGEYEKPSNVTDMDISSISFYPNPVIDAINITGMKTDCNISIYNLQGSIQKHVNVGAVDSKTINVSDLPGGVYFMVLTQFNAAKTFKFVKVER